MGFLRLDYLFVGISFFLCLVVLYVHGMTDVGFVFVETE
jgi:hypothetical protein